MERLCREVASCGLGIAKQVKGDAIAQAVPGTPAGDRFLHLAVTAVAAFDDDVALRTLTALHDLGLSAPNDLAVIGFDDTEYGALSTPALTTVHIDAEAHGRIAARTALGLDPAAVGPTPGRVIIRDSA